MADGQIVEHAQDLVRLFKKLNQSIQRKERSYARLFHPRNRRDTGDLHGAGSMD